MNLDLKARSLGQHNREVVVDQLGFSEDEFRMFSEEEILVSKQNRRI